MKLRLIQRLFVAIGLVTSLTIVSCGSPQQFSFLPNCAPEPQSGPNAVAKVRYKIDVRTTSLSGTTDFKTETQVKALNEPMELHVRPADILLPIKVELLNDKDAVLLTRSISDLELNNENLHGQRATKKVKEESKEGTKPQNPDPFDFLSTGGHRFIDTIAYEWSKLQAEETGAWYPRLASRKVFLVDMGDVIACNAAVVRPTLLPAASPTPHAVPSAPLPTALPTASPKPSAGLTLRLHTTVTASLPSIDKVEMLTTYKDGPDGLYALVRQAFGSLPEKTGLTYAMIEKHVADAGGTSEITFQPGTIVEGDVPVEQPNGPAAQPLVNVANTITKTLPWPSDAIFNRFKGSDGLKKPVTGYVTWVFRYQGQTVATLISNQVTWATEPKETIQARQGAGGGGGAVAQPAPTITSITPNSGAIGTTVTLTGTNFRTGATVRVGGVLATGVNVDSATSITATVPAGLALAAHNVVVTNTDTTTVTLNNGYTVAATTLVGNATSNTDYNTMNPATVGQTFTALGNLKLTQAVFNLNSSSSTAGPPVCFDPGLGCPGAGEMPGAPIPANSTVTANLFAVDGGGLPTGGAVATSNAVVVAPTGQADYTFTFATQPNLTSGTKYALVLSCGVGQSFQAFANTGDPYAGGTALVGGPLAVVAGNDLRFQVTISP